MQEYHRMLGMPSGAVRNLLTARNAGRGNRRVRRQANSREQTLLADLHGEIVVFPFKPE